MPDKIQRDPEHALATVWSEVLQSAGEISADARFFGLGGDSVPMMMMLFRVEQTLHAGISPEQVFEDDSFGAIVNRLSRTAGASPSLASDEESHPETSVTVNA